MRRLAGGFLLIIPMLAVLVFLGGCALNNSFSLPVEGSYLADDGKSRISLAADGAFEIEDRGGEVNVVFAVPGGRWTRERDQLTLSWADDSKEEISSRSVVYAIVGDRDGVRLRLSAGQRLPEGILENPLGVMICASYAKELNQLSRPTRPTRGD